MTTKYIEGNGTLEEALDQIHELLVNDKTQEMQKIVKEQGAAMLSKIFETDPLSPDKNIEDSPKRVKTLSVFVSQCARILEFEQLGCMFNIVDFIIKDGSTSPVLVQMLESYCRQLHLRPDKKFPKQAPIKEGVEKFLAQFELNQQTWPLTIHILQTLLVFDEAKQIFAANEYMQLFSGLLAVADDVVLIKEILGLLHSVLFNITDTSSLYYDLMKQFKEIAPLQLINTVLEKKDNLPHVRFDLIMFLNGSLQPETIELTDESIFNFFIDSFAIISEKNFALGQDNVILGVGLSQQEVYSKIQTKSEPQTEEVGTGKAVDANQSKKSDNQSKNEFIQISEVYFNEYYDILLQNMIRYYSIASEQKQLKFNDLLVQSGVAQQFKKFLEQSTYHDNNHLLISFLQLVISHSSRIDQLHQNAIQKEFGTLGTTMFQYIGKLTVQLFKGQFKQILQEIEDCCAVLVFISLSFQGEPDGFQNLVQLPEITGFTSFVLSLTQIDQLINTVPALMSLFSLLCKDGTIIQLYNNQIQMNVNKSNHEQGPKNNLPKMFANLMIQLQSSPQSQVLVFNVLYGLLQKNPNILKEIEQQDFIQILQSFKQNDIDEYDDLLADVVNCYGKNDQIIQAVEQIIKA